MQRAFRETSATKRPSTDFPSLTSSFSYTPTELLEIESKILVPSRENLDAVYSMAQASYPLPQEIPGKRLVFSSYFDLPGLDIHKEGMCLRLRRGENPRTGHGEHFDLSLKTFSDGEDRRIELEVPLKDPILDLTPLLQSYEDSPAALHYIRKLLRISGTNPARLVEVGTTRCTRQSFSLAVFVARNAKGFLQIRSPSDCRKDLKDGKKVAFEFSLDETHFLFPCPHTGRMIQSGQDFEVEYEFKAKPCEHSGGTLGSDPGVSMEEILASKTFIQNTIINPALSNVRITQPAPSKQDRLYAHRPDNLGWMTYPSMEGLPIEYRPVFSRNHGEARLHAPRI